LNYSVYYYEIFGGKRPKEEGKQGKKEMREHRETAMKIARSGLDDAEHDLENLDR